MRKVYIVTVQPMNPTEDSKPIQFVFDDQGTNKSLSDVVFEYGSGNVLSFAEIDIFE